ncbi:MAG: phosphatase [Opitutaceae bacterium]|nr:phosphatase [Opitutaceae bacterium]
MPSGAVAIVDIGSNSIKVLVATRGLDGRILPLKTRTLDTRISAGIAGRNPRLSEDGMARGVEAVKTLVCDAAVYGPDQIVLVATSAVRGAENGDEFRGRVQAATGHDIRVLTGDEEANLIGRGLTADPELRDLRDFYVFDLGGGSLECLVFRGRRIEQGLSLKLGCVRLMEQFVSDPSAPFTCEASAAIAEHARTTLAGSGFAFSLPATAVAVGTGGTVTTVRAILGAREGKTFEQTNPNVTVAQLRELLASVGALSLADRREVRGLPAARADVFPTALATLIAVAGHGGITMYRNSVYNLRYGVADELLA